MTLDARQIEHIVREVLQALQQRVERPCDAASESATTLQTSSAVNPERPTTLTVLRHVVTVADLDGRLDGIRELRVGTRAIVTPLVQDLLRERKIQLTRTPTTKQTSGSALTLGRIIDVDDASLVRSRLDQLPVRWRDVSHLRDAINPSANDGLTHILVYSEQWAELSCQANREPAVRAVAVFDHDSMQQAWEQIQPNVLIVNSKAVVPHQLARIAADFVARISSERQSN